MRKSNLATLGLAVVFGVNVSQAGLINLGDNNITLTKASSFALSAYQTFSGTYNAGATAVSAAAGTFKLNVNNPDGTPSSGLIYTFCTDVGIVWQNTKKYEALQFSDAAANGVNPAWSAITESIENASWLYNTFYAVPGDMTYTTDPKKAAGMQLAIWKVLYDTVDGTGVVNPTIWTSGNFRVSGGTATAPGQGLDWATGLLTALNTARQNHTFTVYSDTWLHPIHDDSQGMIYNSLTPVPEPTTMLAGAMLLLPFAASAVRFLRKSKA